MLTRRQLLDLLQQILDSPCIDDDDEKLDELVDIDLFAKEMAELLISNAEDMI